MKLLITAALYAYYTILSVLFLLVFIVTRGAPDLQVLHLFSIFFLSLSVTAMLIAFVQTIKAWRQK